MNPLAVLSVALLTAVNASAEPAAKVGDKAAYSGTMSIGQNSYPSTLTLEVTGPGSRPDSFVVTQLLTVANQSRTTTSERTPAEIGDEERTAEFVTKCSEHKGVPEAIQIKSGETLQTCKVSGMQNGTIVTVNYAAVPFLTVRMVSSQGNQSSALTLESYTRGK